MSHVKRAAGFLAFALLLAGVASAAEQKPARKTITMEGETIELMTGDEVRALGFPWVDVPDDENAATYYIKGANKLCDLKPDPAWLDQREHAIKHGWDDSMKALADYLDAAGPALDLFRKGASMKLCQLPYPETEAGVTAAIFLPPLSAAREACLLLTAEARRLEARGKFKEAVDNYVAVIKIGEHCGARCCLIDLLVGIAMVDMGSNTAFLGIFRQDYPREELRRFLGELDSLRNALPNFVHAMKGERAFGLASVDDIVRAGLVMGIVPLGEPSPLGARLFRVLIPERTIKQDMSAAYDRIIAAARIPYYEPEARPSDEQIEAGLKPWNVLGQISFSVFYRGRIVSERCAAQFNMLRVAIALVIYKQDHGADPDDLEKLVDDELLSELPADPFSGKPFKYRAEDGEFVLYSVGENLVDDGGKFDPPIDFRGEDWGFTSKLPPPEKFQQEDETEEDNGEE